MTKQNFFVTFLKKTNLIINNLLKKNLNKLNFKNLSNIRPSNKIFLIFVALIILFVSYLSIPNVYNKEDVNKELKNQLIKKFSLNFDLPKNLRYNFFPRPHFTIKNANITYKQSEVSKIKKLKIYVSLKNLFSLYDVEINEIILEDSNFNLNNQTYDFFLKLLNQNFKDRIFIVKDSNVFYRSMDNEVLFINKIKKMKYYYDNKDFKNVITSKNEIFNLPYTLELRDDKLKKKIFSILNLDLLKFKIENELSYDSEIKKGLSSLTSRKQKSNFDYEIKKNSFIFNFISKLNSQQFAYKGNINFKPFYSTFKGDTKKIDLGFLLDPSSLIVQLLKTEVFNNENLDFKLNVVSQMIKNYENFNNFFLNSKIQDGLIDFDNTKFLWKDFASFEISDSLIFTKNNELILDGKLDIIIKNSGEIYKSLLTPKNYRKEIKKIVLIFNYNFDQKILGLSEIQINNMTNAKINKTLKTLTFKNDKLQNRIYLKNIINKAIKSYSG